MLEIDYDRSGFEWIIMDDGSIDNTEEIVAGFIGNAKLNIRYYKQKNKGITKTINSLVDLCKGDFITRIDTDDYLLPDSLKTKDFYLNTIPKEQFHRFCGVVGQCLDYDTMGIRGTPFPFDFCDDTGINVQKAIRGSGDRNFCIKREILQKFKIPEADLATYISEGPLWKTMDRFYLTRFFSKPVAVCRMNAANSYMKGMSLLSKQVLINGFYSALFSLIGVSDLMTQKEIRRNGQVLIIYGLKVKLLSKEKEKIKKIPKKIRCFFPFYRLLYIIWYQKNKKRFI